MAVNKSSQEFVWPEFGSDRERIKYYSNKYKDSDIAAAFGDVYGMKLSTNEDIEATPRKYSLGDIFSTTICSISKNNVVFNTMNVKQTVLCNTNLYKYEKFKHYLPMDKIEVEVVDVKKDRITVDPVSPLIDKWVRPIMKNPTIQHKISAPKTIKVKNLRLVSGGFIGKAEIDDPVLTDFFGETYEMDAFIPGSQIVLNITDNFEQFNGQTVDTFVTNYIYNNTSSNPSLICSCKEYLKFQGDLNLIQRFKDWCEENDAWKTEQKIAYEGEVTGVINTSKKCGVFVEIPNLKVTGMVKAKPDELVNYKPHDKVFVRLIKFDEDVRMNEAADQMQHIAPYVIEDDILRKCNIKPVFEFVTK